MVPDSVVQANEKQKLYYDGAVRHTPYAVGDLVWLYNPTEDHMKPAPHWEGPYRVLAVLGSQGGLGLTYRIACPLDSDGRTQVVHYDRLKRYTLPLRSGLLPSYFPPTYSRMRDPPMRTGQLRSPSLLLAQGLATTVSLPQLYPVQEEL